MKQPDRGKSPQSANDKTGHRQHTPKPEVDSDVLAVIREEQSRGRRPIDIAEKKRQGEQRLMVLKIYRRGTEQQLRQLLQEWGDSENEIEEKAAIFRRLRQG